jgi:hypothetical protein
LRREYSCNIHYHNGWVFLISKAFEAILNAQNFFHSICFQSKHNLHIDPNKVSFQKISLSPLRYILVHVKKHHWKCEHPLECTATLILRCKRPTLHIYNFHSPNIKKHNLSLSDDYESYLTNDIIKTWTQTTARNNGCPNL